MGWKYVYYKKLPFSIQWTCIKSRQYDIQIDNKVVYAPLPHDTTVNLLCDKLTTSSYNLLRGNVTPPINADWENKSMH